MSTLLDGENPADVLAKVFPALAHVFLRKAEALASGSGVQMSRLHLLGALHCEGPQIMSALGEHLGVTARNVTAIVDALEGEAVVVRTPHATDRRATIVELTPAGRAVAEELYNQFSKDTASLFGGLSKKDQRDLLRIALTLMQHFRQR